MAITYFPVTGNWAGFPQGSALNGSVTFTPNIPVGSVALDTSAIPPLGEVSASTQGVIVNGVLLASPSGGTVELLANTAELNISGTLQYTVSFGPIFVDGELVNVPGFLFNASTDATGVNLITVSPASPTTPIGSLDVTTFGAQLMGAANSAAVITLLGLGGGQDTYLGTSADQAAMLALTGPVGSWTIRTDSNPNTVWYLTGSPASSLGSWTKLPGYPLLTTVTVVTANTAPTKFQSTSYDATGGALAVPLPALSGLTTGDWYGVQRYQLDVSTNALTFTPNGADTFDSGSITFSLPMSGELRYLQVVTVASAKKWKVANGNTPVGSNDKRYFPLNDGPFSGIATMLRHDRCALMQGCGDSTMSGPGRAFDLMATDIGAYYDANVWYMPFDDTNKTYFNPSALRASSRGVRGVGGTGGKIAGTYQGTLPVGNIDVQMYLTPPAWTPSGGAELLTKWDEAIGGAGHSDQKGIHFGLGATGQLYLGWTTDGSTNLGAKVSTANVPFATGASGWVRAVFVANDGSGNNTVTFYTSTSGFNWVQLGSVVTTAGTVTSVYQSTEPYQLLSRNRELATQHMTAGTYVHFVRVRDAAGNDYVPILPDKWNPNTTSTLEPVYNSGAPILIAASGATSGWNLTNLSDPIRYPQLMSLRGADMIIVDDGHNENSLTQRQFIDQYVSYIRKVKRSKPLVPIVCTTQNPYDKAGSTWTSEPGLADLNPTKMAWVAKAMAGESGVWVVDTFQAFTNPTIGNDLSADGRHPSATGYQKKADLTRRFLLPKAF